MRRQRPKPQGRAELIDLCGTSKALYATTDARQYLDYVMTDTPARRPGAAPGAAAGWVGTKQGTPWGALFRFWVVYLGRNEIFNPVRLLRNRLHLQQQAPIPFALYP